MTSEAAAGFEAVIGLEVHVHLATEAKLFCACAVGYGDEPNHHTCPVCLALPGALPVLNRQAVVLAMRAALATGCEVHGTSTFARKNYFYPDLPKGYQISQLDEPLATGGWIDVECEGKNGEPAVRRIRLTRIHMEEDAGKSIHDDRSDTTQVDLNRTSVPLIEVVSEPDLRSPEEAGAYLRSLREILRYAGASKADLEKGQFRCDANVSVRPCGEQALGTRRELKNLNSFRSVEEAVRREIRDQVELILGGGQVEQATLRYEADSGRISVMRLKENADDYRYFPDPDLIPLRISPEEIEAVRKALPELPDQKRTRFEADYGLSEYEARLLAQSRALADFFEETVGSHGNAKTVANWLLRDLLAALKERDLDVDATQLSPARFAALIALVDEGRVTPRSARGLVPALLERDVDPAELVRERGLEAVTDSGLLDGVTSEVIAEHPEEVARLAAGDEKVLNFLMGQVMRKTQGKADAAQVRELLRRKAGA